MAGAYLLMDLELNRVVGLYESLRSRFSDEDLARLSEWSNIRWVNGYRIAAQTLESLDRGSQLFATNPDFAVFIRYAKPFHFRTEEA